MDWLSQQQQRRRLAFNALIFVQFYLYKLWFIYDAMEERQTTFRLLTWARYFSHQIVPSPHRVSFLRKRASFFWQIYLFSCSPTKFTEIFFVYQNICVVVVNKILFLSSSRMSQS
jgi:hypothetical protein